MQTPTLLKIFLLAAAAAALAASGPGGASRDRFYRMKYESSLLGYRTALRMAVQSADQKKEVIYLNNMATVFYALGKPDSAANCLARAREACRGDAALTTLVALNAYFITQGPEVAEADIQKLEDQLTASEYSAALDAYGRMLQKLGRSAVALTVFKRAGKLAEKNRLNAQHGESSLGAARAFFTLGKNKEALEYTETALTAFRGRAYLYGIRRGLTLKKQILESSGDKQGAATVEGMLERVKP